MSSKHDKLKIAMRTGTQKMLLSNYEYKWKGTTICSSNEHLCLIAIRSGLEKCFRYYDHKLTLPYKVWMNTFVKLL